MKKLIIIGATSGIGKEMATLYLTKDWLGGITGRRKALLDAFQKKYTGKVFTSCFDVMGQENVEQIKKLIDQLGGLDLLIYNSGVGEVSKTVDWNIERPTILTNVNGFVEIVGYTFNFFVEQGYGQIAVISSVAALRGNSWAPAYSASKAFISNYAEGLNIKAKKLQKHIVVTDIRPGFINTKMAKGNKRFWVATPLRAAKQIITAIEKRKRVAYITSRWWLAAQIMKLLPFSIFRRLG